MKEIEKAGKSKRLQELFEQGRVVLRRTAVEAWGMGKIVAAVKEELPHGEFQEAIKREWGMSDDSARRLMRIFQSFEKPQLAAFDAPLSAIYMLSEPSVSDETRAAAIEANQAGKLNTVGDAKAFVADRKAPTNYAADNAHNDDISDDAPESPDDIESYGDVVYEEDDEGNEVTDGYGRPTGSTPAHPLGIDGGATTETVNADLPAPPVAPERMTKAQEDALSDAEWLETLDLHHKLIAEKMPVRLFDEAALLWRYSQKPLNELRRVINTRVNVRSGDPYTMRTRNYIDTPHPNKWKFSRDKSGGFLLW